MMVQSTIDKIRDTSVYRTIRKLCGVIDEQNTVVENLQNELDAFDLDGVKTDVTNLKTNDAAQDTKITAISDNVANLDENVETNTEDITYLKSSVSSQNSRLTNAETDILNLRDEDKKLTNALPKTYTLYRNGEGKIQAQVETIDGTLFNSNILDMIIPYQYDIISGTTERSFKLDITMSDGSKYTTNDFIIPAGGGTEVVVTGITLAKDSSNVNRFHVGINLSDSTMIDSGYISMVDNVVATYADSKLTISVNGVSSVPVAIDGGGSAYTAGMGITITDGTIAIDDTVVALKSDIVDMETKTNASATYATKTALASTDANVALAQSTADDANTKANSCFDNVTIADNVLTFTKPDDTHVDVVLPISRISYFPELISVPISMFNFSSYSSGPIRSVYSNLIDQPFYSIYDNCVMSIKTVPSDRVSFSATVHVDVDNTDFDAIRKYIANKMLDGKKLSDGIYWFYFVTDWYYHEYWLSLSLPALNNNYIQTQTVYLGHSLVFSVTISDGEIISVDKGRDSEMAKKDGDYGESINFIPVYYKKVA